jgi:hypothetical protein
MMIMFLHFFVQVLVWGGGHFLSAAASFSFSIFLGEEQAFCENCIRTSGGNQLVSVDDMRDR